MILHLYNIIAHLPIPSALSADVINSIINKERLERCNLHDQRDSENTFRIGGGENGAVFYCLRRHKLENVCLIYKIIYKLVTMVSKAMIMNSITFISNKNTSKLSNIYYINESKMSSKDVNTLTKVI